MSEKLFDQNVPNRQRKSVILVNRVLTFKMNGDEAVEHNLDHIFSEVGAFGKFQIVSFALICIPNILAATYIVNFILTANSLDYR